MKIGKELNVIIVMDVDGSIRVHQPASKTLTRNKDGSLGGWVKSSKKDIDMLNRILDPTSIAPDYPTIEEVRSLFTSDDDFISWYRDCRDGMPHQPR